MTADPEPLAEPTLWVRCTCGVDYAYRRVLSLGKGWVWQWVRDCKNTREQPAKDHEPRLWTENGEHVPMPDEAAP
jgi:hypothetical protein